MQNNDAVPRVITDFRSFLKMVAVERILVIGSVYREDHPTILLNLEEPRVSL